MNPRHWLGSGLVVMLFLIIATVGIFEPVWDSIYSIPYKFQHKEFQFIIVKSQIGFIENIFTEGYRKNGTVLPSYAEFGLAPDKIAIFSSASYHDKEALRYYYRFENSGEGKICVRTRLFAYLFGDTVIELLPGEIKYAVVYDINQPVTVRVSYNAYKDDSLFAFGLGTGYIDLTVPAE